MQSVKPALSSKADVAASSSLGSCSQNGCGREDIAEDHLVVVHQVWQLQLAYWRATVHDALHLRMYGNGGLACSRGH